MIRPPRFTIEDADRAHKEWGANCGPGALAAITGLTLDEVRPHMGDFERKGYTNPTLMNFALRRIGRPWRKIGATWPRYGLVRIQWEGPWMDPGVPMPARYRYTHWIGSALGRHDSRGIFDINCIRCGDLSRRQRHQTVRDHGGGPVCADVAGLEGRLMCDCREAVNKRLAFCNAKIATGFTIDMLSEGATATMNLAPPQIVLEKLDGKKRGKPPTLVATCCPFCGERYKEDEKP
jgi:hypothetical protein